MATGNNINKFSAADIERYHRGLLSAKERHDLEKAALDDPFLADALEGYAIAGVNASADLDDLKQRLAERMEDGKVVGMTNDRRTFAPLLRIAAMLVLVAGAAILVYQFAFNKKGEHVAQVKQAPVEKQKDGTATVATDTTPANASVSTEKKDAGTVTTAKTVKEETKTTASGKATVKNDNGPVGTTRGLEPVGETNVDERSVASGDLKTAPSGGAPVVTTVSPRVPATKDQQLERSGGSVFDKDAAAREETKTKSLAKKQEAAKEGGKNQSQQPDDSKDVRGFVTNPKAEDDLYRKQAMNTFRGRVTDGSNTGLPFANVTNTRDNVGTYTDAYGNFTLTSPDSVLNVQVRSLGYDYNNTQLRNDVTSNKVVMQEDRQNLSEVVVSNQKPNSEARARDANRKLIEPEPVDGWVKYDSYLANNLNVPEDYKTQPATNNNYVQVSFEVDKNGEPVSIRIEKSLCPSCDEEAKRLVKQGPKFKRNANKKGRTTVTINF